MRELFALLAIALLASAGHASAACSATDSETTCYACRDDLNRFDPYTNSCITLNSTADSTCESFYRDATGCVAEGAAASPCAVNPNNGQCFTLPLPCVNATTHTTCNSHSNCKWNETLTVCEDAPDNTCYSKRYTDLTTSNTCSEPDCFYDRYVPIGDSLNNCFDMQSEVTRLYPDCSFWSNYVDGGDACTLHSCTYDSVTKLCKTLVPPDSHGPAVPLPSQQTDVGPTSKSQQKTVMSVGLGLAGAFVGVLVIFSSLFSCNPTLHKWVQTQKVE